MSLGCEVCGSESWKVRSGAMEWTVRHVHIGFAVGRELREWPGSLTISTEVRGMHSLEDTPIQQMPIGASAENAPTRSGTSVSTRVRA